MRLFRHILMVSTISMAMTSCGSRSNEQNEIQETAILQYTSKEISKSVLILSSSPRRGGNSEMLCEQFRKGAEEAGHHVEMLNINDYEIHYFDQTEYDRQASAAETDDAAMIIAKMKTADVIVLSSPVYFYNMTAQMKALIDRTYGHEKDLGEKEFFFIATSTDRDEEATNGVFEAFHGFTRCLYHSIERGKIRGNGVKNRGDIESHPAMQQSYNLGKNI